MAAGGGGEGVEGLGGRGRPGGGDAGVVASAPWPSSLIGVAMEERLRRGGSGPCWGTYAAVALN